MKGDAEPASGATGSSEPPAPAAEEVLTLKPSATECGYFDVVEVSRIADALLVALATACVEKNAGDFFRAPSGVAAETKRELLEYLNSQCEVLASGKNFGGAAGAMIDIPFRIVEEMLESFVRSKRSLFNRMSSGIRYGGGEKKDDTIEDLVSQLDREGAWMFGRREGVARAIVRKIDRSKMNHCAMRFESEEQLAEHKKGCLFRPDSCKNDGCTEVFSALYAEDHDSVCPMKLIPCEQRCSAIVTRGNMDKHCVTVCPMKQVPCPFEQVGCNEPLVQGDTEKHCALFQQHHLLYVFRAVTRHEVLHGNHAQRLALLEKSASLAARFEAVDIGTLSLKLKESEAKVVTLEREIAKLRTETRNQNVSAEVVQLRKEINQLKKTLPTK